MEDYKKKYEDLITSLKKAKNDELVCDDRFGAVIDNIVPELKESEDEKIRKALLESFEYQIKESHPDKEWVCGVKLKEIVAWLKSLKDRVQPKQEWDEEDDYVYNEILKRVVDKKLYEHDLEYIYTWLKSLRPQKQWKPSDADILLLERIANGKSNPQDFQASLCGLIEQLKNLMEE